jgi:peptidoglycan hydrolase CwlO-like protein
MNRTPEEWADLKTKLHLNPYMPTALLPKAISDIQEQHKQITELESLLLKEKNQVESLKAALLDATEKIVELEDRIDQK